MRFFICGRYGIFVLLQLFAARQAVASTDETEGLARCTGTRAKAGTERGQERECACARARPRRDSDGWLGLFAGAWRNNRMHFPFVQFPAVITHRVSLSVLRHARSVPLQPLRSFSLERGLLAHDVPLLHRGVPSVAVKAKIASVHIFSVNLRALLADQHREAEGQRNGKELVIKIKICRECADQKLRSLRRL